MKVALVSGYGSIVDLIFQALKDDGLDPIIIDLSGKRKADTFADTLSFSISSVEEFLELLRREGVTHIAFVGKVDKTWILEKFHISLSESYASLEKGDINLLIALKGLLESQGISLLDLKRYLFPYITQEKIYTKKGPTEKEWEDINFAKSKIKVLADMEIGQTIIVKDKIVYAVEAIEGTNECMRRTKHYGIEKGVLIKAGRTGQGFDLEIPAIGLETINVAIESNIRIIGIEKDTTLFLEQTEAIRVANENDIKVVGFSI